MISCNPKISGLTLLLAVSIAWTTAVSGATLAGREGGYVGVVLPRRAIEISSPLQLRIKSIYVDVGDQLCAHDQNAIIAQLDTAAIEGERDIAVESMNLATLQADSATAKWKAAQEIRDIISELYENSLASEWELRESELQFAVAEIELQSAQTAIRQHKARIGQLDHELQNGVIRPPRDTDVQDSYVVAARYQGPGNLVGPGIPIVRLISQESFVRFAVEPEDAVQLQQHQAVTVRIPALPRTLRAYIEHIAPEVDTASGRVVVEAGFEKETALGALATEELRDIKPGMVVRVHLPAATLNTSEVAPRSAKPCTQ